MQVIAWLLALTSPFSLCRRLEERLKEPQPPFPKARDWTTLRHNHPYEHTTGSLDVDLWRSSRADLDHDLWQTERHHINAAGIHHERLPLPHRRPYLLNGFNGREGM